MRMLLCLLTCFTLPGSVFAQNAFSLVNKPSKLATAFKPIVISRTLTVPSSNLGLASRVCRLKAPCTFIHAKHFSEQINRAVVAKTHLEAQFAIPRLDRPENLYGGYNYLRTLAKLTRKPQNIESEYLPDWNKIKGVQGYNGAHHIVNKSTLEQIHWDMKAKARARGDEFVINLTEMQNNAPAIFHRLHGDPEFAHIFHNKERQLAIYYEYGIQAVIEDFFAQVNAIAFKSNGNIPPVPRKVIESTFLEAELWCKMFHLRWK